MEEMTLYDSIINNAFKRIGVLDELLNKDLYLDKNNGKREFFEILTLIDDDILMGEINMLEILENNARVNIKNSIEDDTNFLIDNHKELTQEEIDAIRMVIDGNKRYLENKEEFKNTLRTTVTEPSEEIMSKIDNDDITKRVYDRLEVMIDITAIDLIKAVLTKYIDYGNK